MIMIETTSETLDYFGFVTTSLVIKDSVVSYSGVYTCESYNCAPDCFTTAEAQTSIVINR